MRLISLYEPHSKPIVSDPWPGLYKHKTGMLIVIGLNTVGDNKFKGMVIREVHTEYSVGTFREDWLRSEFQIAEDKITLYNGN